MSIPDLVPAAIGVHEPESLTRAVSACCIGIVGGPTAAALVRRADGGVIPAGVQVVCHAVFTDALAAVPDEEEAAGAHAEEDDDEAQDWEGDHDAQVHIGGVCARGCERHA